MSDGIAKVHPDDETGSVAKEPVEVEMVLESEPFAKKVAEHDEEKNVVDEDDEEYRLEKMEPIPKGSSVWAAICSVLTTPILCHCAQWCYVVPPVTDAVVLHCGSFSAHHRTEGIYCTPPLGRKIYMITRKEVSVDLPTVKCLDARGSPINVSALIVYRFVDTEVAALGVADANTYVLNQATSTLRKIVSQFVYEDEDPAVPSLKTHQSELARRLRAAAQRQIRPAGAECLRFQLNEISYAPEIAAAMLKRQQAVALVQARRTLVTGCTQIALDSVKLMEDSTGRPVDDRSRVRVLNNVIAVTISGDR